MKSNGYKITDKHVLFWGSFLSNFYPCHIRYMDHDFVSSEHLFMYIKAVYFGDHKTARSILATPDPKTAKEFGRKVKGFDESVWNSISYNIMYTCVYQKFKQNQDLQNKLFDIEFDGKTFVEGSPYDKIWGIGISWDDLNADDESKWKGENRLGKVIDEVRVKLKRDLCSLSPVLF